MSDPALQRTVRRCAAVLTALLSLLPMLFIARIRMDYGRTYSFTNPALAFGDELALVVCLVSVTYLLGSAIYQLSQSSSGPDSETE